MGKQASGAEGEALALDYLLMKGYTLLHRNWRHGGQLELDLVMLDGTELVIVEVKTLSTPTARLPEDNLSPAKLRKLYEAATAYCALQSVETVVRFDLVAVQLHSQRPPTIRHHENID